MAETKNQNAAGDTFKEAVCIDAGRVYDSCCDRDCLEDLRCYFTAEAQETINNAISVRLKSAQVLTTAIDVQPVSFNRGYYSCDLTFFFMLDFDVFTAPRTCPTGVTGVCCFNKKVILFGSDGNVKVFSSTMGDESDTCDLTVTTSSNMPKCVVQCVDPVCLTSRIGEVREGVQPGCIPEAINEYVGGDLVIDSPVGSPTVYVTLGLFTIVQLIRDVQMLIPVYDFCIPEKQCDDTADQPCDVFRRIKFPTDDFFPPRPVDITEEDI